ncbi:protein cramped-like isoform X2 [Liolophura sinensis]|uniref:protein cramped-like isoform X2 n=1 Tax=Liolophura sinensis TaxID=3198878 RepID=UPI0031591139
MPVGKRRKSSQSECGNREKQGVRMTTDHSNVGIEEKPGTSKESVALPATVPQRAGDLGDAIVASGTSTEKEKIDEVDSRLPAPVMPVPTHMSTRSSTRVIKKPRRDTQSPTPSPVKKTATKETKTGTPETKTKRQWELWGNADKKTFFDGLYEFGKDFDAIQGLIAQKCKRRGVPPALIKNKDQVRHFYYRTWHKISKYIHFCEGVKKQIQELYGLINYGEMRKRIGGSVDERYLHKLNQLIHKGSTYVRIKGKNHRVRTPVCNALKKLNRVEEPKADNSPKVPAKVSLEVVARTNCAWSQVQELAQNPRLRISLKASHRLAAVIAFLEKKWKPQRLRIKESLDTPEATNKQLRLFPHKDCHIHPVSLKTAQVQVRPELHFDSYKENVLGLVGPKTVQKEVELDGMGVKNENSQSGAEGGAVTSPETKKIVPNSTVLQSPGIILEDENAMFPDDFVLSCTSDTGASSSCKNETLASALNGAENKVPFKSVISVNNVFSASQKVLTHNENATDILSGTSKEGETTDGLPEVLDKVDYEDRIRKGWSLGDCESLTLAELYLMFGEGGKLKVEYDWCEIKPASVLALQQLTNLLRRLVHLATTEFTDFSKLKQESKPIGGQVQTLCQKCSAPILGGVSTVKSNNTKCAAKGTAAKSTSSPSNKSAKKARASSPETRDPVFRVPAAVLTQGIPPPRLPTPGRINVQAAAAQAGMLLSASGPYKRNRPPLRKPMIVKRRLLPKAHVPGHQLMTLAMVPTSTMAGTAQFLPMSQPVATTLAPAPVRTPCIAPRLPGLETTPRLTGVEVAPGLPAIDAVSVNQLSGLEAVNQLPGLDGATCLPGLEAAPRPVLVNAVPSLPIPASTTVSTSSPTDVCQSDSSLACQLEADLAAILPNTSPQGTLGPPASSDVPVQTSLSSPLMTPSGSPNSLRASPGGGAAQTLISPPSMSSILELSFAQPATGLRSEDKILDMAMGNRSSGYSGLPEKSTVEKNQTFVQDTSPATFGLSENNPPLGQSPFKLSDLGTDSSWLGPEVSDISLSGFLESPEKQSSDIPMTSSMGVPPPNLFSDTSRDLSRMDVDSTLQCMLNESSMDYAAKFADIAAQMAASVDHNRKSDSTGHLSMDTVQ